MANDLEYSVGLNTGPLAQASMAIGKFGDDAVKTLNRKFSGADLFRGIMQGIGIASVAQIADKMVAPFKESAESAERIAQWSDKAADATERLLMLRRSDAQQLEAMEKSVKRIAAELNNAVASEPSKKFLGFIDRGSALDKLFGFSRREDAARAEQVAQKGAELNEKNLALETKRAEIQKRRETDELRAINEAYKTEREREAALRRLADFDREQRLAKLSDAEKLSTYERERVALAKEIAGYERFTREGGQLTKDGLDELLAKKQQQAELEKQIAELTAAKAKSEALIGSQIDSNVAAWKDFVATIESVGRGDRELSDRELRRKINEISSDIATRQASSLLAGGLFIGNGVSSADPFINLQKSNLAQALAEQRLREETRRNVEFFGRDRAFQMFGGTEQRFESILQGFVSKQDRFITALEKLEKSTQAIPETLKSLR
jgi:hypothetical protein